MIMVRFSFRASFRARFQVSVSVSVGVKVRVRVRPDAQRTLGTIAAPPCANVRAGVTA